MQTLFGKMFVFRQKNFISQNQSQKSFQKILTKTIQSLQNAGFKVFVCSLFPINSKRYFDNVLTKKYDAKKILLFLNGDRKNLYRYQESYNNILRKCVAEANATLIDFRSPLLLKTNFLEYLSDDGIHPNEMVKNLFLEKLIKQLKKRVKRLFLFFDLLLKLMWSYVKIKMLEVMREKETLWNLKK